MHQRLIYVLVTFLTLMSGPLTTALTLEEYGVQITDTGLLDTTNGLEWLNTDLTAGTTAALDPFIEDGWRIATVPELIYLLSRQSNGSFNGGPPTNPLAFEDLLVITDTLGLAITDDFVGNFQSPWLCMSLYEGPACQVQTNTAFTQLDVSFEIVQLDDLSMVTELFVVEFLTEVPLYGDLFDGVCDTCVGRTFMVRNVPLPAGVWLLFSALSATGLFRIRR